MSHTDGPAHGPAGLLGALLRTLRLAAGLTQEELAERAGISARTVSDLERGLRSVVRRDTAQRLGSVLGLDDRQRIEFVARAQGLTAEPSPGLATAGLPLVPTPFIGRSHEVESIAQALHERSDARLLTLTGPGGIGKTRLALEVARRAEASFAGQVFFVDLGDVKDASLVAPEIAKALGVVETGAKLDELLARRLAAQRTLIVLDTFEHLVAAAPLVYGLLLACPDARFLVTSRSALRLRGEREFPVLPLALPSTTHDVQPEDVPRWAATGLFWERVQAVRPDLELDIQTAQVVVDICRNLDGLPLAIELAAARVRHMPLPALRDHLEDRLRFLVGGPLDLPLRQRTMRDTVAWSHGLLGTREATLFRRLAAFSGGWSLTDVPPVCGSDDDVGDALEGISALVDQSLVIVDRNRPGARYHMLDVIREYAAQQLGETGEGEHIARRHALHYLTLAEEAEPNLIGPGHADWFRRLEQDRGNLRRAMAWSIEHAEPVLALRFTVALWRFWRQLGEFVEGRRWSDAVLERSMDAPVSLQAKAVWATAALAFPQGDYRRMAELGARAGELALMSGEPMDRRNALTTQGMVAMCEGRYAAAMEPFREAIDICRELGHSWQLATSYLNLGVALLHSGSAEEAEGIFQEGLSLYRQLGDEIFAARISNASAQAALALNQVDRAEALGRAALSVCVRHNEPQGVADGLEILAAVAAARADPQRTAMLCGAAAAVREQIASRPAPFEQRIIERFIDSARRSARAEHWRQARDAGYALTVDAATAYALREPVNGA